MRLQQARWVHTDEGNGLVEAHPGQRASLIEGNPLAMWILDLDTQCFVEANESALQQYGYRREEFMALSLTDLHAPDDTAAISEMLRGDHPDPDRIYLHRKKDGTQIEVRVRAHHVAYDGRQCQFVVAEDVTERRSTHARLLQMAHHDALTGLPNRILLSDRIDQAFDAAKQGGHKAAIVCVDLDRFKHINDWYGHAIGDECLKQIGTMLTRRLRGMDTVARTGGEEFTIVLGEVESVRSAKIVGDRLVQALRKPLLIEDHSIELTGSFGIAVYPDHGIDHQAVWRSADAAMYRAKRGGGNSFVMVSEEIGSAADDNIALNEHVRKMLQEGGLHLHYQVQFQRDGSIRGVEALLRLPHPTQGYISPDRFITRAEENGLIHSLGAWVLEEVCRQMSAWNPPGGPVVRITINVSPLQLAEPNFVSEVETMTAKWGVDPSWLEMEITERVVLNFDEVVERMRKLNSIGVRFAVDDFGVGYSSMQHLHRLPISSVKIDRSFVQRLCEPGGSYAMVEAIVSMGHSLNMQVVAEGVETTEQKTALDRLGCDAMQGFLLGGPMPAQAVEDLLGISQAPAL